MKKALSSLVRLGAAFFLFFFSVDVPAATFTVNVFDDPAPAAPNGCVSGGRCSLREAVLAANANMDPDEIILGEGTYHLTIPEAGTPQSGDLDIVGPDGPAQGVDPQTGNVTLKGAGKSLTIINADDSLKNRIFDMATAVTTIIQISDLTLQNGKADINDGSGRGGAFHTEGSDAELIFTNVALIGNQAAESGGAVYFSTGGTRKLELKGCSVFDNRSVGEGGGVYLSGSGPTFNLEQTVVRGNRAGTNGGGVLIAGGDHATNTIDRFVVKSEIRNNQALNGNGGGIYLSASTGGKISETTVIGNTATQGQGGGIYLSNGGPAEPSIENCIIQDNKSDNHGGGVYASMSPLLSVIRSTFSNNEIRTNVGDGGGLFLSNGGGILVSGSTFNGNSANNGGGLYHVGSSGSLREITNSTFSGNKAKITGGGIWVSRSDGISLNSLTFVQNTAEQVGGGVLSSGLTNSILRNSLFSQNTAGGPTDDCGGSYVSQGYNIFSASHQDNADCGAEDQNHANDKFGMNPNVGPLADNGGPNLTHALLAGSQAINGGNPSGCEGGTDGFNLTDLTADQRGQDRPLGGSCDVGAVEQGSADAGISMTADPATVTVGSNVDFTVTVKNNGPDSTPGVTLTHTLPAGLSFLSSDSACSQNGQTITCRLEKLVLGASGSLKMTVKADAAGQLSATAAITGSEVDPNGANNTASAVVTVNAPTNGGGGGGGGGGGCGLVAAGKPVLSFHVFGWILASLGIIRALRGRK